MGSRRPRPFPQRRDDGLLSLGDLRFALETRQFELRYQPEVDMRTGELLAVEALVRWNDPDRGERLPDDFIGAAEESDLIAPLGEWVIDEATTALASWATQAASSAQDVSALPLLRINVSPAQLTHGDVIGQLTAALDRHRLAAGALCVEFTETAPIEADVLRRAVDDLHDLGVLIAIDDIATGYSTLARLRALPVDSVKIDRELIVGIAEDERARAVVGGILGMSAALGADVVAEGVEISADAETLVALGCFRGQGHLFGRPEDEQSVARRLATDPRN